MRVNFPLTASAAAIGILAILFTPPALAQASRNSSGGNAQLLQQMQQLAAERTALQGENARMKRELAEIRKERDELKNARESNSKRVHATEAALARSAQERESAAGELAKNRERTEELVGKFRETIQELRTIESERATAQQQLAARDIELKTCVGHNTELFSLNAELLDRLDGQGFWSGVARAEPFTRLKRVQLENFVDEYKARAEDAQIGAPAAVPPAATEKPRG